MTRAHWSVMLVALGALAACGGGEKKRTDSAGASAVTARTAATTDTAAKCPGDNAGLTLPAGFCATVFADSLGHARGVVVAANGDVYVNTWTSKYYPDSVTPDRTFLVLLRDSTHDGRADVITRFGATRAKGSTGGTGIAIFKGALYAEAADKIVRLALATDGTAPAGDGVAIVSKLPLSGDHPMHPFVIDTGGAIYLDVGSASNSCQLKNRTLESPGNKPCTELETRAGIWSYDANKTGQTFSAAGRYATGIRNAVGIAIGPGGALYSTQHGRDQLAESWPKLYSAQQGQELPAEELMKIEKGADYGWPVCYFDNAQKKLVLAPEYGGDGGKAVGECATKKAPVGFFPAHWAPDGLVFVASAQVPEHYRSGAFISFHGSWNRAPGPQGGYKVVFVPFTNDAPPTPDAMEVFADGFAGGNLDPARAAHRPVGIAIGADGALYVADDVGGRVYRITHR
ncbi:MAG: PQQ-dependent sugar dehydrogenase [Gemmatimonadota bacterium]|nr:PQQ-dependent sugar dehydrogenase [Gemmatimonadota bacterium]